LTRAENFSLRFRTDIRVTVSHCSFFHKKDSSARDKWLTHKANGLFLLLSVCGSFYDDETND